MAPDLDPELEAAARRRLTALATAITVPPATAPPGVQDHVPDRLPEQPGSRPHPRRSLLAAGAAAFAAITVAAVGAAVLAGRDDGPGQVATTPGAAASCDPLVATDGVVASGALPDGGRWDVLVAGAPPLVATTPRVDGAPVGGSMSDEASRASLVNRGEFGISAELTDRGTIVWGDVPRATDHVEVTVDGAAATACPAAAPTDQLVRYFGIALPRGPHTTDIEVTAFDARGRILASAALEQTTLREVPRGSHRNMTADPSLVPLPLGSG
jgi:hypothetical protein